MSDNPNDNEVLNGILSELSGDAPLNHPNDNYVLNRILEEVTGGIGGGGGVETLNSLDGDVTLSAGANVSLNIVGNDIEISATGGGEGSSYTEVNTHADLPVTIGNPAVGTIYVVKTSTGIWLFNRKEAGLWRRAENNGTLADWVRLGDWAALAKDANMVFVDDGDTTKSFKFEASGITTETTRTLTIPDASGTIALTGQAPTAHASTHKNGGSDEIATATAAANAIPKAGEGGKLDAAWIPNVEYPTFNISGNGSVPAGSTSYGFLTIPYSGTITNWYITSNVSGSCVVDIKRSGTSIIGAGNKPTLSSAASADAAVSSWTSSSITAGDILELYLDSATTVTGITVVLKVTT